MKSKHAQTVKLDPKLISEISSELSLDSSEPLDIMDVVDWKQRALPLPGQDGPVLGIDVHTNKVICGACGTYGGSITAVRVHRREQHPDSTAPNIKGPLQTMASTPTLAMYFTVPKPQKEKAPAEAQSSSEETEQLVALLKKTKLSLLASPPSKLPDVSDARSIPPVLIHLGVPQFLSSQERSYVSRVL